MESGGFQSLAAAFRESDGDDRGGGRIEDKLCLLGEYVFFVYSNSVSKKYTNSMTAFGGMLGSMVKMMVGAQLVDRFGDYSSDLRNHFEQIKKGKRSS